MKTFLTEKHNIPEGATHYSNETRDMHFAWRNAKGETQVPSVDLEWMMFSPVREWKPIPQTKVVEWVDGLPPIGEMVVFCFADYELPMWLEIGDEVEIICHDVNNGMPVAVFKKKTIHGIEIDFGGSKSFSKLETEAERAERERLENGQSLYELVQSLWCTVDSKYTPHPYGSPMVDDKTKEMYARLARAVDYRKESE